MSCLRTSGLTADAWLQTVGSPFVNEVNIADALKFYTVLVLFVIQGGGLQSSTNKYVSPAGGGPGKSPLVHRLHVIISNLHYVPNRKTGTRVLYSAHFETFWLKCTTDYKIPDIRVLELKSALHVQIDKWRNSLAQNFTAAACFEVYNRSSHKKTIILNGPAFANGSCSSIPHIL